MDSDDEEEEELDPKTKNMLIAAMYIFALFAIIALVRILDFVPHGKSTAKFTATFREVTTYHMPPNQGTDYLASLFSLDLFSSILCGSPVLRWVSYVFLSHTPFGNVFVHPTGRTWIIDDIVETELSKTNDNKYEQFVILGAGYDTRALRFEDIIEQNNINVFEVDLASTQGEKLRILELNHHQRTFSRLTQEEVPFRLPSYLKFVSMDFNKDSLLDRLERAGYKQNLKTLFIFEGVSFYLPASSVSKTLRFVSEHSGLDSLIIWDLFHSCILEIYTTNEERKKFDKATRRRMKKYCEKLGFRSVYWEIQGLIGSFSFNWILREPFYFGLFWDLDNPFKETNENNNQLPNSLIDFHSQNCLKLESYFDTDDSQSYLTYNISKTMQRTLVRANVPGWVTVTGRKTEDITECEEN